MSLYDQKHDLVAKIYLLTVDLEKTLQEEQLDQDKLTSFMEERESYMQQVDQLDSKIQAGQPAAMEDAKQWEGLIQTIIRNTLALDHEIQNKLRQRMDELKGDMRELAENKRELSAYVPALDGSMHIDVSQ